MNYKILELDFKAKSINGINDMNNENRFSYILTLKCNDKIIQITDKEGKFMNLTYFPQSTNEIKCELFYSICKRVFINDDVSHYEKFRNFANVVIEDCANYTTGELENVINIYLYCNENCCDDCNKKTLVGVLQFYMNEKQKEIIKQKMALFKES